MSETLVGVEKDLSSATRLRLRPGAAVFAVSSDKLLIVFSNYTVTFTGPSVVKGMRSLTALLGTEQEKTALTQLAAEETGLETSFIEYLLDLLERNSCLYEQSTALPIESEAEFNLSQFYSSTGADPGSTLESLALLRPIVIAPSGSADELSERLYAGGITAEVVSLLPGTTCAEALAAVAAHMDQRPSLILSWNISYRLSLARSLNELSIERGVPILFGTCEGLIARIGPYVIPQNTACLECLNKRLLTHAGPSETQAFAEYRIRYADSLPEMAPTHPVFQAAAVNLFVLEVSRIALRRPPETIGGVIEYNYVDSTTVRRPVFKVPRCKACHIARASRIPWNARFPAPVVKDGN